MIIEQIKDYCDFGKLKIIYLSFYHNHTFEFNPDGLKSEIKRFIEKYCFKIVKGILIRGTWRKLIDNRNIYIFCSTQTKNS
ncbi:MAG: hypothetical protein ACFFAN_17735 [Promethearchaeota archaeon]